MAADIVLAIDQSNGIVFYNQSYDIWSVHVLDFVKRIAGAFTIDRNSTQIGLLKFSSVAEIVFELNRHDDRQSLLNAVNNIRYEGGPTNIAAALHTARQIMFTRQNGARPGTPKYLILLTDGVDNKEATLTLFEADQTKAANITIFTVGITQAVDKDQLQEIASSPDYFFFASNLTHFNAIVQALTEDLCNETTTTPTATERTRSMQHTFSVLHCDL